MLDAAIKRALLIVPAHRVLLVTAASQSAAVSDLASTHGGCTVVIEPSSRGTTAALLLALDRISPEAAAAVVVSMPADHIIHDDQSWAAEVRTAMCEASDGGVVALGIVPHRPATEYGYIEMAAGPNSGPAAVERFHEKPDYDTAVEYIKAGVFLWNTAIMAFRQDTVGELLRRHAPEVVHAVRSACTQELEEVLWEAVPSVALEHSLMEPAALESAIRVVPARFDWRDVGTWDEAVDLIQGTKALQVGASGNTVVTETEDEERRYVFVGVDDLVVVDDGDVVLVTTRGTSQLMRGVPTALADSDWADLL